MSIENCTLSLIICTYNRPRQVELLLNALGEQTRSPDEIVVVDASSGPETERVVRALNAAPRGGRFHYHRAPPEHRGLTRQRNYGFTLVHGDLIAFLDDDTVPEPGYFEELVNCMGRHPSAAGAGGYIENGLVWTRANTSTRPSRSVYRFGEWQTREDIRWRVRRVLHLDSPLPPGWMPPSGHGRTLGFIRPDGEDHHVESLMGGASVWRGEVLRRYQFSPQFDGYGLYEDLDFCLRAAPSGPLYLCTRARLAHYHAPSGRPAWLRFGQMVVCNGWAVWKRRWPSPPWPDRLRWWATTLVLIICRYGDAIRGPARIDAFADATGRVLGIMTVLWRALLMRTLSRSHSSAADPATLLDGPALGGRGR